MKSRNEKGQFVVGHTEGKGRPKGSKSFSTLFDAAIRTIAKEKKLNIKNPEQQMVMKAIIEALRGNYSFYRDILDRRYGKPKESLELSGELKNTVQKLEIKIIDSKDENKHRGDENIPKKL